MKHIIKNIEWNGSLVYLDDQDLIKEWETWNEKYQKCKTTEIFEEGRPIYDKIRKKYNINTLICIGHIKGTHTVAITISNIPIGDIIYHDIDSKWAQNYIKNNLKILGGNKYKVCMRKL